MFLKPLKKKKKKRTIESFLDQLNLIQREGGQQLSQFPLRYFRYYPGILLRTGTWTITRTNPRDYPSALDRSAPRDDLGLNFDATFVFNRATLNFTRVMSDRCWWPFRSRPRPKVVAALNENVPGAEQGWTMSSRATCSRPSIYYSTDATENEVQALQ